MDNYSLEQYEIKDTNVLATLESEVGSDVLAQLLTIFKTETQTLFSQLNDALNAPDTQELTRLLHSIKSGAKSYGATRLAVIAAELESNAREDDKNAVANRMQILQLILSDTLKSYS